jgi:hypothetical protein
MFRRKVFYLSGFDPRGPRFYHGLHREALARHGDLAGESIAVSRWRRGGHHIVDWSVTSGATQAECSYLCWQDLVRASWLAPGVKLWWRAMVAYYGYLRHTSPRAFWRLKPETSIILWYPLLAALMIPLLAALALASFSAWLLPVSALGPAALIGLALGVLVAAPLLERMNALWLIRSYIYKDGIARHGFDDVTLARMDHFAAAIARTLRDGDEDEVLLVAHSSGSVMAVPLLLRLIERWGGELPARFTMVTMGQCLPLLSNRLDATAYHAMLRQLSGHAFNWIDIGAQHDAVCFHGIDPFVPVTVHGSVRLSLSAPKVQQFWSKASCSMGWHNKYHVHFTYLRCGDTICPVDYPSLTVAPRMVGDQAVAFRTMEQSWPQA